ncbi:hypothetical protein FGO68_gene12925 [Halteria grandinella]|uniref:Uncharacterized protein n=1 Tax=Halteria grandinella TaxID=5974 RepID=A0A8J8NTA1_HALGN|nr:hypothetical protein FGO68_gene12925 [Halteria grandinella]
MQLAQLHKELVQRLTQGIQNPLPQHIITLNGFMNSQGFETHADLEGGQKATSPWTFNDEQLLNESSKIYFQGDFKCLGESDFRAWCDKIFADVGTPYQILNLSESDRKLRHVLKLIKDLNDKIKTRRKLSRKKLESIQTAM